MCFGIITPAILTNIIILLHIWIKKLKSYMGKILRRKTESNFLSNIVFSFSKSGGCTPPPIRIKITPPLSYRPRLLAIGKLKFRIKPLNYVFLVSLCLSMVILAYPDARGKNQDLGGLFLTVYAQFDRNPCFSDKFSTVTQKKIGPRQAG